MSENPYASPRFVEPQRYVPAIDPTAPLLWRDGKRLVVPRHGGVLPNVCVKSNRSAEHRQKMKFEYLPHSLAWAIAFGALGVWVAKSLWGKKVDLEVPLNAEWLAQRKTHQMIGWGVMGVGILLCIGGPLLGIVVASEATEAIGNLVVLALLLGLALVIGGGLYMGFMTPPILKVYRVDDHFAWFEGASAEYLATLPDFGPPR